MNLLANIIFKNSKINSLAKAKNDFCFICPLYSPAKAGGYSESYARGYHFELPQALACGLKKALPHIGFSQILFLNQLKEAVK